MSLRSEFVALATLPGANLSDLCRRYGISRKTGYKWCRRPAPLDDQSRRPHVSPQRTTDALEALVLATRDQFPDWGARKLKRYLQDRGHVALPAVSTITAILQRHGRISPDATAAATPWQRFEHAQPNALWQIDFKGHVAMTHGRCHPLTLLDDHSRFNLLLHACAGEGLSDVQVPLIQCFRRYGLPYRISCDNGPPWGTMQREDRLTRLGVWLIQLGVGLTHAQPCHPQTNGKDERFHRTLDRGLLQRRGLLDLRDAQHAFDAFREVYNQLRPHEALAMDVPVSRYRPSERPYPERLPPIDYAPGLPIRQVDISGRIQFQGRRFHISHALRGLPVALQPDPDRDGQHLVYFCHQSIGRIDLTQPPPVE
jgi:transposase InsO family protein